MWPKQPRFRLGARVIETRITRRSRSEVTICFDHCRKLVLTRSSAVVGVEQIDREVLSSITRTPPDRVKSPGRSASVTASQAPSSFIVLSVYSDRALQPAVTAIHRLKCRIDSSQRFSLAVREIVHRLLCHVKPLCRSIHDEDVDSPPPDNERPGTHHIARCPNSRVCYWQRCKESLERLRGLSILIAMSASSSAQCL